MLISLVIPTYNRSGMLADALESVARSKYADPASLEVIVADNNSSDDTAAVIAKIREDGFPFELIHVVETRQGASETRNKGISVARGVYVVFMDDDQRIEENYLSAVERVFRSTQSACIGGPVFYGDLDGQPDWLMSLLVHVGQFDAGRETRPLSPKERMLGSGNMAIKREALEKHGGFDETLGRRGKQLMANEDLEIQQRMCAAGETVFYSPELIQYHYLRPERLKKSYWRRHQFDWGRTRYRYEKSGRAAFKGASLFGAPRWFWRSLITQETPRFIRSIFVDDATTRFHRELEIFFLLGKIREARSERR